MAEEEVEKTPADKINDVVSQLKEMEHYSKTNVEKLTEFWLLLDDQLKEKQLAGKMDELLSCQNNFHELVRGVIEACEEKSAGKKQ